MSKIEATERARRRRLVEAMLREQDRHGVPQDEMAAFLGITQGCLRAWRKGTAPLAPKVPAVRDAFKLLKDVETGKLPRPIATIPPKKKHPRATRSPVAPIILKDDGKLPISFTVRAQRPSAWLVAAMVLTLINAVAVALLAVGG